MFRPSCNTAERSMAYFHLGSDERRILVEACMDSAKNRFPPRTCTLKYGLCTKGAQILQDSLSVVDNN
jgi:hypothetical protein